MTTDNLSALRAFVAIAREGSFTRAAALLGVSPSALSQSMKELEDRLGIRLLARTTRSVSPTEHGARLLSSLAPRFEEIEQALDILKESRDKPAGTLRITTSDHAADTIILPKLSALLLEHPDINLEIITDYQLVDIVEQRLDAGVRLGDQVAKDMIAVRIGPDMEMALVGSPSYFSSRELPKQPQDLTGHNCINLRLPTHGGMYALELVKGKQELSVRVTGQLVVNNMPQLISAALMGLGLAFTLKERVEEHIQQGRLISILEEWCPTFPGYHLYYPSRRHSSPAFTLMLEALRYRS